MTFDIILCGVGGQGVLSLAAIIAASAKEEGLHVKQAEVHGMAVRGGAVVSHLRLSDSTIYSDLVSRGGADMILSMEPLESLRYTEYLKEDGVVISSKTPVENIANYPDIDDILNRVRNLNKSVLIDAYELAKQAGAPRVINMVMVGAASKYLPVKKASIKKAAAILFARKGNAVVELNEKALLLGAEE